ncbi:TPA: IS110 family transposase [Escherichia coli]|nr:IS110 family transposase [Escherichia coli]
MNNMKRFLESITVLGTQIVAVSLFFGIHPGSFIRVHQATAYSGIDPRLNESGGSVRGFRLSKTGNVFLRKSLYMPAMTTLFRTERGKQFYARLSAAGKPLKLIIGSMMRKLIHFAFGVLGTGEKFDKSLHCV